MNGWALKCLDSDGSGLVSDAIDAWGWGYNHGVPIFSNSWGGKGTYQSLQTSMDTYSYALFICAAGNEGVDSDLNPYSPGGLPCPNAINVASTDHHDQMAGNSNYGVKTVDVGAPGVGIFSSYLNNQYISISGTSMVTPHVAGVAALVSSINPSYSINQVRSVIFNSVDKKRGLNGKVATGGRVNVFSALNTDPIFGQCKIGVVRRGSAQSQWILANEQAAVINRLNYVTPTYIPITGDWNGDVRTNIGVVRRGSTQSLWTLASEDGTVIKRFNYGLTTDTPIAGDWTGPTKIVSINPVNVESIEKPSSEIPLVLRPEELIPVVEMPFANHPLGFLPIREKISGVKGDD